MSRTIRLDISYDGTDFSGWQMQAEARTVQGCLEQALVQMTGQTIRLAGASRTDAGVHALGQVASFDYDGTIPLAAFHHGLNTLLPDDLRIKAAQEMPLAGEAPFHAQKSAREKIYHYYCLSGTPSHPILQRYAWPLPAAVDFNKVAAALRHFIGTHDFTSFCAAGSEVKTKTRTISEASISHLTLPHPLFAAQQVHTITLRGNGFLKHMVRNIVGTVLAVGQGKLALESIPPILQARDRTQAGPTAPAKGLFLVEIFYP